MGNLLQYTDKSKTIDMKLETILAEIDHAYRNGEIRIETEYYYRVKNALTDFYDSLTKPTFKYRPAVSTPVSEEYNAMITESVADMEYIIKDCENLSKLVTQSFSDAELSRSMLTNSLQALIKKTNSIRDSISVHEPVGTVVFTELFSDMQYSGNFSDADSLTINTSEGILCLSSYSKHKITVQKVSIDPNESNGLPGNTHCADIYNSELHFSGEEGLHNNLMAICDNTNDTWFEFETFNITDETRISCNSFGFDYDEGVQWITDSDKLRLKLIIDINSKYDCSWLTLKPYLSEIKGVKPCIIEKCEIITTANNAYVAVQNKYFDNTIVCPFPPHSVKRVILTLLQTSKYQTKVGHFFHVTSDTASISAFQEYDEIDNFARVDGDKPSVSYIGCKYNPKTKWVDYPDTSTQLMTEVTARSGLFTMPVSTIEKKAGQELIDAYRYLIGIREVSVSSNYFRDYGEYVTEPFTTQDMITSVCIESEEYIPGDDVEAVKYYISLNGGTTWHKIYPTHRAYDGIYKYYINNDSIANQLSVDRASNRSKALTVIGEPKSIQLKITMEKPTENGTPMDYASPIIYSYRLKLTTGGGSIEY